MISRRNIRIKALQSIYALLNTSEEKSFNEARKILKSNYDQTIQLAIANLLLAKNICEYCIIDENIKSAKRLPTANDLNISKKPAQNIFVIQLIENASFNKVIQDAKLAGRWSDSDIVKNIYQIVIGAEAYKNYIANATHTDEDDKIFFKFVLQTIATNEDTISLLEDLYINFEEDKLIVDEWITENFNQIQSINFTDLLPADKSGFGLELVETFLEKTEVTMELIKPKLINWEADRIAMMDLIILQLGITELLYFPSIPTKVSINEYIDLAKAYSTMQSGQFVNGVLDKIHKELAKENKLHKVERPNKKDA
jgi:transcription antitermination protein NusB